MVTVMRSFDVPRSRDVLVVRMDGGIVELRRMTRTGLETVRFPATMCASLAATLSALYQPPALPTDQAAA